MTRGQISKLNMFETVDAFLKSNTTIWNVNNTLAAMVGKFSDQIAAINELSPAQQLTTVGITATKKQAKTAMADKAAAMAAAGKAYAHAKSNSVLFNKMSVTKTNIIKAADNVADDIATNIYETLLPIVTNLSDYGVTANSLADLQTAITTFSSFLGQAQQVASEGVVTTGMITKHFEKANDILTNSLDLLMVQFKTINANFYNSYRLNRSIQNIGHRKTVLISGVVHNSKNKPQAHVQIHLKGKGTNENPVALIKHTKADGKYRFTRLPIGDYKITASFGGHSAAPKTFAVNEAQTLKVDFVLMEDGVG